VKKHFGCLEGKSNERSTVPNSSVIVRFSVLSEIEDTFIEGGIRHESAGHEV